MQAKASEDHAHSPNLEGVGCLRGFCVPRSPSLVPAQAALSAAFWGVLAGCLVLGCAVAELPCDNTCQAVDTQRICASGGISTCTQFPDGCWHFGVAEACPSGQLCVQDEQGARCATPCQNACPLGARSCDGNAVIECVMGEDGCTRFGEGLSCGAAERCDAGSCVDDTVPCEDDCPVLGDRLCASGIEGYRRCEQNDGDECHDLGPVVPCSDGEKCRSGSCERVCPVVCTTDGERQCMLTEGSDAYQVCQLLDACLTWSAVQRCPANHRCDGGSCVEESLPCDDECTPEGLWCDGAAVISCSNTDSDVCLDRTTVQTCDLGSEECKGAACAPLPVAALVISELYYDSPGEDDIPGNLLFAELAGPPGTQLSGYTLVGMNGTATQDPDYVVVELSGSIPARGRFVIVHPDADASLLALADLVDAGVNFQNGNSSSAPHADAVQLRRGELIVDAVGYGNGADNAYGEGAAAAHSTSKPISRDAGASDSGDNAADFSAQAEHSAGL